MSSVLRPASSSLRLLAAKSPSFWLIRPITTQVQSVTEIPFFSSQRNSPSSYATSNLSGEFQFPEGTLQFALSPQSARKDFTMYRNALENHGVLSIQLGFYDPSSSFLQEIVQSIGSPITHSDKEGALWDIKFKPEGVRSDAHKKDGTVIARSHTLDEFVWHTDASYEDRPPRFFGLHVIQPDNMGGGIFRVVPVANILDHLGASAFDTLRTYPYRMKVPPEFYRGKSHHTSPLIDTVLDPNPERNDLIRYRGDIIEDPPEEHVDARTVLTNLKNLLANPAVGFEVPKFAFKENSLIFLDNARFLHMRTPIKDPRRWLRRVRFHPAWTDNNNAQN